MKLFLTILNIAVAIIIVFLILMQGKGAGLGSAWGGGGELFQTRRGIEKLSLRLTVIMMVIFFIVSLVSFFIK